MLTVTQETDARNFFEVQPKDTVQECHFYDPYSAAFSNFAGLLLFDVPGVLDCFRDPTDCASDENDHDCCYKLVESTESPDPVRTSNVPVMILKCLGLAPLHTVAVILSLIWGIAIWSHNVFFGCCKCCRRCTGACYCNSCCNDRDRMPLWEIKGRKYCLVTFATVLWLFVVMYTMAVLAYYIWVYYLFDMECPDKNHFASPELGAKVVDLFKYIDPPPSGGLQAAIDAAHLDTLGKEMAEQATKAFNKASPLWKQLRGAMPYINYGTWSYAVIVFLFWFYALALFWCICCKRRTHRETSRRNTGNVCRALCCLWVCLGTFGALCLTVGIALVGVFGVVNYSETTFVDTVAKYFESGFKALDDAKELIAVLNEPKSTDWFDTFSESLKNGISWCEDEARAGIAVAGDYNQVAWQIFAFGLISLVAYVAWFKQWHYWRNLYYHEKKEKEEQELDDQLIAATVSDRDADVEKLIKQRARDEAKLLKEGKTLPEETVGVIPDGCSEGGLVQPRGINGALHYAACFNKLRPAVKLLRGGFNVNARNVAGFTPLQIAAMEGHSDMVALLVAWGASFDDLDDYGEKTMHALARGGHHNAIRFCVESCGADPETTDMFGRTPRDVATAFLPSKQHEDVIRVLETYDAENMNTARMSMTDQREVNFRDREAYMQSINALPTPTIRAQILESVKNESSNAGELVGSGSGSGSFKSHDQESGLKSATSR